ncbi:MAG: pseudouridine synthase [Armatimonadetes bacterium]|nr:pseudouridine synthase [Armatimonadota bacterium]
MPRLQKVLASAGVASRRASEVMIQAGRVTVNGKRVTEAGVKVDPQKDEICVDGASIATQHAPKKVYILLNKPLGYQCTVSDPHAKHSVMELLAQVQERIYPVGRLDEDSEGVLLLTNDGDFAFRLTHPRYHVPKVYLVRVKGFVERQTALKLSQGVELDDGMTAPAEIRFVDYDPATQSTTMEITLYEGRNRQVRRMMDLVGHPVRSLQRTAFGNIKIQLLNPGTWRKLRHEEVTELLTLAKVTPTPKKEQRLKKRPYQPPHTPQPLVEES